MEKERGKKESDSSSEYKQDPKQDTKRDSEGRKDPSRGEGGKIGKENHRDDQG